MVTNNNTAVSEKIRDGLKINQATENTPTRVADSIVPVFVSNPERKIKMGSASFSDGTTSPIFTTSAIKKTYLVAVQLSIAKDVNNDGTYSRILLSIEGQGADNIGLIINYEPVTAGQFTESLIFTHPVLLQKGTSIKANNNTATASIDTSGVAYYYEVED